MEILRANNLFFSYFGSTKPVLNGVDFGINQGDFVCVCGASGCGKSTLLRLFKKQLMPEGKIQGETLYCNQSISCLNERSAVTEIGFVMQNPEHQIVTDKVWHELAFGLESLGEKNSVIRTRVAETACYFGIHEWYHKNTSILSGGQKQLLNLAAVMVMQPKVLILDEPTAQLDPIAASDFMMMLKKINDELGVTILMAEHRLEDVFSLCSKIIFIEDGKVIEQGTPKEVGSKMAQQQSDKMFAAMPSAVRLFSALGKGGDCPINVREGKAYLSKNFLDYVPPSMPPKPRQLFLEEVLHIKGGYFRYEKKEPNILKGIDFTVYKKETVCILGGNGAGKTTLLRVLTGNATLNAGSYKIWKKNIKEYKGVQLFRNNLACLPQNPLLLFVKNTVKEDLLEAASILNGKDVRQNAMLSLAESLGIAHLLESHPYDLSGGELQKVALCKVLLLKPEILLLDEPTKGLDAFSKRELGELLKKLKSNGKTIVMVTHDVEFAALYADRCALFFDGQIVSDSAPKDFFTGNRFYTTATARMTKDFLFQAVTVEDATALLGTNEGTSP